MAIIRTYDLQNFDPVRALLKINVQVTETVSNYSRTYLDVPFWLPVAPDGTVPSGGDLSALLDRWVERVAPEDVILREAQLFIAPVSNASELYQLTSDIEPGEAIDNIFAGLIPVLVYPDRIFTPTGNVFTRSIIAAVGGSNGAPSNADLVFPIDAVNREGTTYILDNGNVGTGAVLRYARDQLPSSDYATVAITGGWAESLPAPAYVIEQYPFVFRQPLPPGNFEDYLKYYYIEHEPLVIATNFGTAWIQYS
jgi:hypothetical protein